jgi:hypothetical protein
MRTFSKIGLHGCNSISIPLTTMEADFLKKSSHLREKGGVLILFKTTRHLGAKAQSVNSRFCMGRPGEQCDI